MELDHSLISPETEFWGHCSNLQAWYESNYDTRILHRNLAFPLLKRLTEEGDTVAKKVFKEEIAKRLETGHPNVVLYLIEEEYLEVLNWEEFYSVIENPRFLKNLSKWFRCEYFKIIPKKFAEIIKEKLRNLYCPYCGVKVDQNVVQKVVVGKGVECRYCSTCIIKGA